MPISENQMPVSCRTIISEQVSVYEKERSITIHNEIPDTDQIPLLNPSHWLRIPDVICVFVDLKNSTKLSAETQDKKTAGAYQLFSGTAVRIFDDFESPYIEVQGDGVFALFNQDQPYRAIAAAVTFKTFADEECIPRLRKDIGVDGIGCHIGIDQQTVLVKKIGIKNVQGRYDRQNEVWAGKPVNMASKLASQAEDTQLIVSDRFFKRIQNPVVTNSCGCRYGEYVGTKDIVWKGIDVQGLASFDFEKAYIMSMCWCRNHGKEYCEKILALDK